MASRMLVYAQTGDALAEFLLESISYYNCTAFYRVSKYQIRRGRRVARSLTSKGMLRTWMRNT